jgi:site-specific DNA recombinase
MSVVAHGGAIVGEHATGALINSRCIIYARVSTEDQARKGYSLADQVESCIARGIQLGYKRDQVVVLKDEGMSGDLVDRPGLNRLRELVSEAGAVGHVVIYDPDRFARNLSLQLIVTEEIVKGGAALEFINFEWKNTPEGKLFYSLRGAIAEYEKAKIKERTRRGREQKAKQGLMPVGKDLFGYKFNPDTDKLEPIEEEQAVLRLLRDLILHGPGEGKPLSCVQAAKWLAANGVPAPKGNKWYASTVTRMIRNESYTGTYWVFKTDSTSGKRKARPREQQYKIEIPPVWDEATWRALVARIETNKWLKRGRKSQGNYLLKGLIYCGVCGDGIIKMRGNSIKDRRRDYQYYICYKNHGRAVFDATTGEKVKCPSRHWPGRQLDDLVWKSLKDAVRYPERMLERFNEQRQRPDEAQRLENELQALQSSIIHKEAECNRYLRLFAMGHIDSEAKLDEMLKPAKRELATLKERSAEVEGSLRVLKADLKELEEYLLTLEQVRKTIDGIKDDDFEAKREILAKLVKRVIVGNDGVRIAGYLSIPFDGRGGSEPGTFNPRDPQSHVNGSAVRQLE